VRAVAGAISVKKTRFTTSIIIRKPATTAARKPK
jgi:hypothetical protein